MPTLFPDKKYLTKQWLGYLTLSLLFILLAGLIHVVIVIFESDPDQIAGVIIWSVTAGIIVLMWIIAAPITILWIRNLSYAYDNERVTIFKGILTKKQQNIPFRAITDFQLKRSLYDRLLGIGSIMIQTAGQGAQSATGYEGQLAGLLEWENIYKHLRQTMLAFDKATQSAESTPSTHASTNNIQAAILQELQEIRKILKDRL